MSKTGGVWGNDCEKTGDILVNILILLTISRLNKFICFQ